MERGLRKLLCVKKSRFDKMDREQGNRMEEKNEEFIDKNYSCTSFWRSVWIRLELEKAKNFHRNWKGMFKFLRTKFTKEKMDSEKE